MNNIILRRAKLGAVSTRGIAGASQEGLLPLLNTDPLPRDVNYLFRWGCTSPLAAHVVVQPSAAITLAHNKASSRLKFQEAGVRIPTTWFSPEEVPAAYLIGGVITRPAHHHQGRMVFRSYSRAGLEYSFRQCQRWDPEGEAYCSEFIPKEREFRIFVIQGRVGAVAEKIHPAGAARVAWNKARGASFQNVTWDNWPLSACYTGVAAAQAIGLDFGGIDVMTSGEGEHFKCWVLEPNAAPSLSSPYRQQVFAKCFDYMIANGKQTIPLGPERNYRALIHPALRAVTVPEHEVEVRL